MELNFARKYLVFTVLIITVMLLFFNIERRRATTIETARCPQGMVYVPSGYFIMGTDKKMVEYLTKLCNRAIDNCLMEWFSNEMPRRNEYVKGFCIEQYESPNLKGTKPLNGISWIEAGKWCESRGRRLC
ncbi:MAG: hypothetical protein AB1546_08185, partial [bacterium]